MFSHILVATDLTERSLKALDVAVRMVLHDGGRITLLHVVETIEDTDPEEVEAFYRKLGKRARRRMAEMAGRYAEERPVIGTEIIYGKRVREIIRFAEEQAVDLVILSSHPVGKDSGLEGWGTISYKVGMLSPCPVMLVK